MIDPAVISILSSLGLNEREIEAYVALLGSSAVPASIVSKRTGMNRSTAQYTCQQLHKKGLVMMIQKGNAYLFSAEPPEKLLLLLEKEKRTIEKKERETERIIGQLKSLMNPAAVLPKVQFFEGRDGILQGYKQVIASVQKGQEILSYLHALEEAEDQFDLHKEFTEVTNGIRKKGIINKVISPDSQYARAWQKTDTPPQRVTKIIGTPDNMNPTEIMIFGDSVYAVAVEQNQLFGYLAQNKSIAAMHRAMFMSLWNSKT